MLKIIIDEDFKALLPSLDKDTYAMLEENIIQNGCRDSIVLWDDVLIDGHNRFEICNKHSIPFNTISKDFTSRDEALIWIISTQVARRNLTPIQLSHFRGLHYMADKKIQGTNNQHARKSESGQNDHFQNDLFGSTATRLAERYRVSPKTIRRDAKVAAAIETIGEMSRPAKTMILSGEVGIEKSKLGGLSERPREDIAVVATAIENGTYEKRPAAPSSSPIMERPVEIILAKICSVLLSIDQLSDSFSLLPKIKQRDDREKLRAAIRSCINQLEELYDSCEASE